MFQFGINLKNSFIAGFLLRTFLIFYAKIHDYMFLLKYTDKDYFVFTDAAQHVANGESPFMRTTYRYTPALAWFLLPCVKFPNFGKFIFALTDILLAYVLYKIANQVKKLNNKNEKNFIISLSIGWLFNPLSFVISSRGSSDALVCLFVMISLYLLLKQKWFLSSIIMGLFAIHLKIYPIIYLPSIFFYLSKKSDKLLSFESIKNWITNYKGILYINTSLGIFYGTIVFWYQFYGELFLNEYLFYHIKRVDTAHNFSPYYLLLYQSMESPDITKIIGIFAFIPQFLCIIYFAILYHKDLPFCWFITTISFVSLNKVCTSQYFLWYICFLPLIYIYVKIDEWKSIKMFILWLSGQFLWMFPAYLFEFHGFTTHYYMWLTSLIFLSINFWIMGTLIKGYKRKKSKIE
uniref:GPI alpha-1,4-mannosyltransferase I, catalytic subunit n=1 Tax=Strongyloides stercoralis TaxID=6248 RepID=A0A0K0EHW2_STRER